ncbi:hypothetical protein DER46DRAFT_638943 [Fusarium sp. MPI-SDFR-AT-0072]|nr:hypothetical protein DER46DRAFT_638943 [Fusarium sp. MPI-SDFR-AT-0072]
MLDTQNMASPWPLKDEFISSSDRDRDKAPWHRLENLPTPFAEQYARLSQPWLPGFWIRFPYRGLGMWLLALLGTIAAVMILVYSDGVPIDHWDERIQPTVWLALSSALSGAFLACAFTEGAAISYWRAAGKPVTLQQLQAVYGSSTGIIQAALNLFTWKSKTLGMASILMTLSVLRGPLMQRASSTTNHYRAQQGTVNFHIARELPENYACIMTGRTHSTSLLTKNFSDVAQNYSRRSDMAVFDTSCTNCTTAVEGFGFDVNCTDTTRDFNLTIGMDRASMLRAMDGAYFFQVNVTEYSDWGVNDLANGSFLRYTTLYKDTDKCSGKVKIQTCDLHAGIAKFPVRMDGKTVELQGTWKDDKFIKRKYMLPADMVMPGSGNILGGFSMIAKSLYESQASMRFTGATGYDVSSTGLPATQYLTMNGTTPGCGDRWDNPMEDIIELTRDIGFRASLQYAKYNTTDKQKVQYDSGTTTLVYVTNYEKMWIAIAVSLVGIFAVLPTFWGWWELGRDVSLNPLEIANAFGTVGQESHIMRNVDPNQNVGGIVNAVNDIGPTIYPPRPSPLRLPGFELSPSPVSRRESHHGRSVSPNISPHWVSIETPNATTPPLEQLQSIGTLEGLNNNGQCHRIDPCINAIIDKGFFQSDGQWTCYRRNYFSVICSYSLFPQEPESHIQLALPGSPEPLRVHGFAMTITAVVAGDIGQNIELVQHTPKRDKGPIMKPVVVKLSAKTSTQSQRQQLIAAEHTFERVQFKQATMNNGKRRAQQQYHQLVVSLLADVGEHDADRFVKVAERRSVRLVVRGRSPGHYQNLARPSVGSMVGLPAAGSDIASEQGSQNSAAAASGVMFRETQIQSVTSSEYTQEKVSRELEEKKQVRGQDITIPPSARKPGLQIKTEEEVVVRQESPDSYQPITPQLKLLEGQKYGDIMACEESSSSAGMTEETAISDRDEKDVYDTWIEDKKQSVIDAVMRSLCKWLDSRLVYVRGMTSSQAETSGSSSTNADSGDHTQPSRGKGDNHSHPPKRRRTDPSDGDDEDGEEGVREAKLAQRRHADEPPRFACPYFKRDPGKYCREATCVGPGWVEIHRVKRGHLYRRHALPPQCPRCWQDFKTEQLRDVHLQADPPCQKKTNETNLDGFTKTQEKQLKSRKKSEMEMTGAGKWREMYQILFPDDDPTTIPDPCPSDSHTPAAFATFARREFPRFVRRELEVLFQSEFQDVEERIRPRVQDIVLNLQPRLIALYEQSAGEVGGRTALTAEISTPLADKDAQGAQGREVSSPLVPNPLADNSPSTSWPPNQIWETPSFDFGIDWDLLSEDLFNYPLHGQFAVPQLEKFTRGDLQVVGRRQPTIGQA